jgi:hypothetical protein
VLASNFASHSGSSASFSNACSARFLIVGILKGRFSVLFPGLGIHILLVGEAFVGNFSSTASLNF